MEYFQIQIHTAEQINLYWCLNISIYAQSLSAYNGYSL